MGVQTKATLTFATMGTNFPIKLRGIAHESMSRPSINLSSKSSPTAATNYAISTSETADTCYIMEKAPGAVVDLGRLRCEVIMHPHLKPPIYQPEEGITVTFARSSSSIATAAAFSCKGFCTEYDALSAPWEEEPLGTMTIELTPDGTNVMQFTAEA